MPPKIGTQQRYRGQIYIAAGTTRHICRNGRSVTLVIWRTKCPECGHPFEFNSLANFHHRPPIRRCPLHRVPGKPVEPKQAGKGSTMNHATSETMLKAATSRKRCRAATRARPNNIRILERTMEAPFLLHDRVVERGPRGWFGRVSRVLSGRRVRVHWDQGGHAVKFVKDIDLTTIDALEGFKRNRAGRDGMVPDVTFMLS